MLKYISLSNKDIFVISYFTLPFHIFLPNNIKLLNYHLLYLSFKQNKIKKTLPYFPLLYLTLLKKNLTLPPYTSFCESGPQCDKMGSLYISLTPYSCTCPVYKLSPI